MTVNYGKDKSLVTRQMKSALPMHGTAPANWGREIEEEWAKGP
jgi:hypothetical protein